MSSKYWVGAKNILNQIIPFQLSVGNGAASSQANTTFQLYSVSDLVSISQSVTGIGPGGTPSLSNTNRIYHHKCDGELSFTNSSNAQVFVDIYVLQCKRATFTNPIYLWTNGFYDETQSTAVDYSTYYGSSPLDSVALTTYFACKAIYKTELQPGQCHVHKFNHHFECPVNNELLQGNNQSDAYLNKQSYVFLIVAKGIPVSATAAGGVLPSQANIDFIMTKRYSFKYITDQNTNYKYTSVSSFGTTPIVYNQGSGATVSQVAI